MHRISFGIVGFLGILMPGALLIVNIILPLSVMFDSFEWITGKADTKADTLLIIILLLIAFTAGTILRTFPPKWAEWLYRCKSKWCFQDVLERYMKQPQRRHFSSIPDDVWDIHYNPKPNLEDSRKYRRYMRLFNFAKKYVIAKSERLSGEVQTAEGLSRFTSSVFWCSLAGVLFSSLTLLISLFFLHKSLVCVNSIIYFGIANLFLFIGSARGIGLIRLHEGEVVMQSFFCTQLLNQELLDAQQQQQDN